MKALVLGATGGSGQAIVLELLARGIPTILFGRNRQKLETLVSGWGSSPLMECVEGDVYKTATMISAFEQADVVFQCANGGYIGMVETLPVLAASVMAAAEQTGKNVVFVDGVYVYGRSPGHPVGETYPMNPHTRKGQAKLAFAHEVHSSRWKNARATIVRLPDYYGPTSQMAFLDPTLQGLVRGTPTIFIGSLRVPREYVYLPDAAKMIVNIALRDEFYGQNWNNPGQPISGDDIIKICQKHLGRRSPVFGLGCRSVNLLGLFVPAFKEMSEMMYLTEEPLMLDGTKYELEVGAIPRTSFEDGLAQTLKALGSNERAKNLHGA